MMEILTQQTEELIEEVLYLQKSSLLRLRNSTATERILKLKSIETYMLTTNKNCLTPYMRISKTEF